MLGRELRRPVILAPIGSLQDKVIVRPWTTHQLHQFSPIWMGVASLVARMRSRSGMMQSRAPLSMAALPSIFSAVWRSVATRQHGGFGSGH